jgi:hypothetical protein
VAHLTDQSFGLLTVDGSEQTRDLIVLPDRIVTNTGRTGFRRQAAIARQAAGLRDDR